MEHEGSPPQFVPKGRGRAWAPATVCAERQGAGVGPGHSLCREAGGGRGPWASRRAHDADCAGELAGPRGGGGTGARGRGGHGGTAWLLRPQRARQARHMQRATIIRGPPGRASRSGTGHAVAIGHRRRARRRPKIGRSASRGAVAPNCLSHADFLGARTRSQSPQNAVRAATGWPQLGSCDHAEVQRRLKDNVPQRPRCPRGACGDPEV
jgi:hypothetical protein